MASSFSHGFADDPNGAAASLYRYVLHAFPRLGRVPAPTEVGRDLGLGDQAVARALEQLETHGALRLDPGTRWIGEVYPYSAGETRHEVAFESGVQVHCMCAIDCFYVPFLTDSDVTIRSSCHLCEREIEIGVVRRRVSTVTPCSTVVWDSAAPYDCPTTNFFCCETHLREWRERNPDEPGAGRSIDEALERGRVAAAQIRRAIDA